MIGALLSTVTVFFNFVPFWMLESKSPLPSDFVFVEISFVETTGGGGPINMFPKKKFWLS